MYFTLDIRTYKFPYDNYVNSAVYALKLADLFHINSNYEQVIQNDWCDFDINAEKIFLANLLNEKQRTEQKMMACSSLFNSLVAQKETIADLTHQNINAFVLFLETFALEDTYVSEGESKLKEIRKIKKEYFSHFYFQPKNEKVEGKPDFRLISDARNSLLHISRILTLDDCRKFIGKNLQIKDFFINMSAFTEGICTNVLSAQNKVKVIKCSSFLAEKTEYKHIGAEDDLEQLGKFLKNLYITENNITDVTLQEIMFDLIVNVIPLLDSKREKVGPLGDVRNDLVHNFQKYDSPTGRLREMKRLTFPLKSNLFKYFYAKKVHDVLKKYCLYETYECLDSKIVDTLIDFENDFLKIAQVASTDDANSFEYLFEESIFPKKDEAIDELVQQYFECMIIFDYVTGLNTALTNDDGDQEEGLEFASDITDLQRREIFEDMVKVKSFQSTNSDFSKKKLMELKSKLKQVGIREALVDNIIEQTFNSRKEGFEEQTKKQMGLVRDNIFIFKHLVINDLIPFQTLISSYKSNNLAPLLELFKNTREKEQLFITKKFESLLRGHFKIMCGDDEI
uniref:(northern house mosquito) hypothetical protein n=1 Tax=Culex pipiens TaxID=7175 RepID=A0A8D8AUZ5_CULPI